MPEMNEDSMESVHGQKNPWLRIAVYVVVVGLLGVVGWRVYANQQAAKEQVAAQAAALAAKPAPVQVSQVTTRPMPIFLTGLGTVTPYMSVTVKARVSGELLPVHFTEGQQVRTGETILSIDPKPYVAALNQAKGTLAHDEALLKNAQAQYKRYKALYDAGVTSKETLDTDEAAQGQYEGQIAADKAAVETARLQVEWCRVTAPISGKIGLRMVDPGNIITANTTNLVMINQMEPIAVYFTLPEGQLPQVMAKLAAAKQLTVEAWDRGDTQKIATGRLLTIDNQIDTTTGTGKLKAVFDNKDGGLFPNQFVNIHLVLENRPDATVIPSVAMQTGSQGHFVWVIDTDPAKKQQSARMQPVKVAMSEGSLTILDGGLTPGQTIVVDGADRLRPGQIVVTSEARGGNSAAPASTQQSSGSAVFGAGGGKAAVNPMAKETGNKRERQ